MRPDTERFCLTRLYVGALPVPTLFPAIFSIDSCWLLSFVAADRLM